MTDAEVTLWLHIRKKQINGLQFFRQKPIGNYIVDFYSPDANLVVEVDGGLHYEDVGQAYDEIRDALDGCEYDEDTPFEITEARAVIAADREKNK